jgi:hypothetical protein
MCACVHMIMARHTNLFKFINIHARIQTSERICKSFHGSSSTGCLHSLTLAIALFGFGLKKGALLFLARCSSVVSSPPLLAPTCGRLSVGSVHMATTASALIIAHRI